MKNIAIVGIGEWGKNILRNLDQISDVSICCHRGEEENKVFMRENYPSINLTTDLEDILEDDSIDAVVIATPPEVHFEIAKKCLESEKDLFIEKPMTTSAKKSRELEALANKKEQIVFVGYIFLYHPVFSKVQEINKSEKIKSIRADWRKTGSFSDKITYTLSCHDLAIAYRLFDEHPEKYKVLSQYKTENRTDILKIELNFNRRELHGNYNRVFPGKNKSVTFETEKDNIYVWKDKTLSKFDKNEENFLEIYKSEKEPLKAELESFIECIENQEEPVTDATFGKNIDSIINEIEENLY